MSLGDRLRSVREYLRLKQPDMAARMGVALTTYGRYERDKREPQASELASLATVGINLHWLLTGEGTMAGASGDPMPLVAGAQLQVPQVDAQLMGRVVDAIRALYKAQAVGIADIQVGRLAADWYNQVVAAAPDDAIGQGMALAAKVEEHRAQLRRDAADPARAKRPA